MKTTWFKYLIVVLSAVALAILVAGCPGGGGGGGSSPTPTPTPTAPASTESGVTVKLVEHTGTDPEHPELHASTDANHIRWSNVTAVDRKIHFSVDWPFMEASGDITVAPGAMSAWYTLDPAKVSGGGKSFPYTVSPTLVLPTDGPDAPEISGQP